MNKDKDHAIMNPSSFFLRPDKILKNKNFTTDEKRKALLNWKDECEHLQESVDEGMGDSNETPLREVQDALNKLDS